MKVIGLVGGMSWESTAEYYRLINLAVRERLGGQHSARILMFSVDFEGIERKQHDGRWAEATEELIEAALRVERGGADFLLLCTNTMHKVADAIRKALRIPLLHLVDATAEQVKKEGISRVGLLGTRFTMEEGFYRERLSGFGLDVIVPDEEGRRVIHDVIYRELCQGRILDESRHKVLGLIESLRGVGAQGVILGCTELPLLVQASAGPFPVFDTTAIHARRAVDLALEDVGAGSAPEQR